MLVEVDQVAVDSALWARVVSGEEQARSELRKQIDGLQLYMHALSTRPSEILVSLRDLEGNDILYEVKLTAMPEREDAS